MPRPKELAERLEAAGRDRVVAMLAHQAQWQATMFDGCPAGADCIQ